MKMRVDIENPMLRESISSIQIGREEAKRCDCGSLAKMKVVGQFRCYECAEDEGIHVLSEYRRYA